MTRTDSMPLKYHKDEDSGKYKPVVDAKKGKQKHWNWKPLLLAHESSHVIFTLATQAIVGAFVMLIAGDLLGLPAFTSITSSSAYFALLVVMNVLLTIGLYKLNMHLGKPHRFYRGFYNLRHSPVSREIAGVSLFYTSLLGYTFFSLFNIHIITTAFGVLGLISGPVGVFYMYKLYRIKARPFWDHWQTASSFIGTCLSLGALTIALVALASGDVSNLSFSVLVGCILAGLLLEAVGHIAHAKDISNGEGEGAASWYLQTTQYGWPFIISNILLACAIALAGVLIFTPTSIAVWVLLFITMLSTAFIRRSLFFALVIPTTMPGAFFWKNKGFEEHAKETGLANMQQVGVEYEHHREFKLNELMDTIKTTKLKEAVDEIRAIFA